MAKHDSAILQDLRTRLEALEAEMRVWRVRQAQTDETSLETLVEYLFDAFGTMSFTSNSIFYEAQENPLLRGVLIRCLGPEPTIQALSKLLMKSRGLWGEYSLKYLKRGNVGAMFTVLQCSTPARNETSTVY